MWITSTYPQVRAGTVGTSTGPPHTVGMNRMQLTSATSDHLASLLRRTAAPSPPSLPPGSRTTAALQRAAHSWTDTHREADTTLREHVQDVRAFADRVQERDARLASTLGI